MLRYRVGSCWRTTIVQYDDSQAADEDGRRPSDRLVAMGSTAQDAYNLTVLLNRGAELQGERYQDRVHGGLPHG